MQAPMQSSSPRPPLVYSSFGERRSISHDLARFSLDLGPSRTGASRSAHTVPYPSPPMSHSPPPLDPLSPKQDARRPSGSITLPHDIQGIPGRAQEQLLHSHEQQHLQGPVSATVSSEGEGFPAPFPSLDNGESPHPHLAQVSSISSVQRSPFAAQPSFLPPQLPRRTKSHVASACVNCKKAHLACDGMFTFFFFDNFLGSFFLGGLFGFISLLYGCPSAGNMCFTKRGLHFFRSRRSARLSFWHELYFFWAARFRHMSYYPGTGCRRLPHGFIR